jgi:predicted O-linked N-acetylglucosamine transferase (SPINDLY family)
MTLPEAIALAFDHHKAGRLREAESIYRQVLQQIPREVNALHGLGYLTFRTGRGEEGMRLMREAIEVEPDLAHLHWGLAEMLHSAHREEEAAAEMSAVIRLQPDRADAYINLGLILLNIGRVEESAEACRRAIELDPKNPNAHNQMACAYLAMERPEDAADAAECALELGPGHAGAANNLGAARMMQGRVAEAVVAYRRAVRLQPDYAGAASNLLFTLHYSDADAETIAAEHARWGKSIESGIGPPRQHRNNRDPERRLRIGYVSGDFRKHAIEYFIEPILANHDRTKFELTAYANNFSSDATTQRLRAYFTNWQPIHALSNEAVAELIARDEIDILIDLSVHTAGNRLGVFALKPAPVQMSYLGYPGTTGLTAIDYRITAGGLNRPDVNEGPEKLLVLPHGYFCYQPPASSPDVTESPALSNGFVTFGSFNRLAKLSERAIATWTKILKTLPEAKLLLLSAGLGEPRTCTSLLHRFAAEEISPDRLILLPSTHEAGYREAHQRVDIALDSFPYNGGTTTLHALWMGVPVISLAGQRAVSRLGLNILNSIGLHESVAQSEAEFVEKACALAADLTRLNELRRGMRQRLQSSPVMNGGQFTRDLEALYRQAWLEWVQARE